MVKKSVYILLSLLAFYALPSICTAQSKFLGNGIGGSSFEITTAIDNNSQVISVGAGSAFSIGGIMDFGFKLNRGTGTILGYDRTDWNFNFKYNLIVIKQTVKIPISFQLEGSYGYTNITSEYLDIFNYQRYSRGFELGVLLFHEINQSGFITFLFGGTAAYSNYNTTELNIQNPNAPVINNVEKDENIRWGGLSAFSLKPQNGPFFTLQIIMSSDVDNSGWLFEPSFIITSPSMR